MKKDNGKQSLLGFYIITLVLLTVLCYLMLFLNVKQQNKQISENIFYDVYEEINSHLEDNQLDLVEILTMHTDQTDVSYKVMVIAPSGQLFLHSNRRDDQKKAPFFTLPYWGHGQNSEEYHTINSQALLGWGKLPHGYELYIKILHKPITIPWSKPFYWLPILIALLLLLIGIYHSLRYGRAWGHLIEYTNSFSAQLNEPYQPLRNKEVTVGRNFQRLTNSLNRINQQLHQAHRTTRKLNKRLRRITDFSPLPMLMIHRNGQIGYFNRRFEQSFMTGFQDDTTYFVTDFVTGRDKSTQLILTKLSELRIPRILSVLGLENNIDYLLHLQPWIGEQGQVQGFIALLTDISTLTNELKDIDIKIQQQANKLIEYDKLWSVLGHELRTPLSGMIGLLELMDTDSFNQEQLETYRSLENTSESMLSMLNDMLDMAKMEAGKLEVVEERTDLLELCHQVVDLMSSNARRQNIELLIFFDPLCPRYMDTDSGRVRQALTNLLGNAIKFTKVGYVALHIKLLNATDNELITMASEAAYFISDNRTIDWICFKVQDTGIGISEEEMTNLFTDFGQANKSISRQFGGTGLGLTISNNFARLLGGFIHVKSESGVGSEFTFCLPFNQTFYQPAYQFNVNLSSICLVAFNKQVIATRALNKVANYLNIACMAYTGVNEVDIQRLSHIKFDDMKVIFLIEDELYGTDDVDLIFKLDIAKRAPKILLGMQPKSALSIEKKNKYDSFLTKPLTINQLIKELLHLSSTDASFSNTTTYSGSKVQKTFEAFMEQFEKEDAQAIIDVNNEVNHTAIAIEYDEPLPNKEMSNKHSNPLVLIAEDNPINQKVARKLLERLGYRTIVANNGQDALNALNNRDDISLILMDCRMPIMNGLEATRLIRADKNSIPIIALTANDTDADREECILAGMNAFLSKPIRKQALIKVLDKFMIS